MIVTSKVVRFKSVSGNAQTYESHLDSVNDVGFYYSFLVIASLQEDGKYGVASILPMNQDSYNIQQLNKWYWNASGVTDALNDAINALRLNDSLKDCISF